MGGGPPDDGPACPVAVRLSGRRLYKHTDLVPAFRATAPPARSRIQSPTGPVHALGSSHPQQRLFTAPGVGVTSRPRSLSQALSPISGLLLRPGRLFLPRFPSCSGPRLLSLFQPPARASCSGLLLRPPLRPPGDPYSWAASGSATRMRPQYSQTIIFLP